MRVINANFSKEAGLGLLTDRIGNTTRRGLKILDYSFDGWGTHYNKANQAPQVLAQLALLSPTHGSAIERTRFMIQGLGLDLQALTEQNIDLLEQINKYGESFEDLHEVWSADMALYRGMAALVYWNRKGQIAQIESIPFQNVRVGRVEDGEIVNYVVSNMFGNTAADTNYEITYSVPPFNPAKFKEKLAKDGVNSEELKEQSVQLIYLYKRGVNPSFLGDFYPIPDYFGCMDSVLTEIEIGVADKSLLDNGMGGKYMVSFYENGQTNEEKDEYVNATRQAFAGASNNGGIITTFTPLHSEKDLRPVISKLDPIEADTYEVLSQRVKQDIITAHQIPAILLEYNYGGGFNNRAEELKAAFDTYQKTKISSYQTFLTKIYNKMLKYMGIDGKISVVPFSLDYNNTETQENEVGLV